MMKLMLSVGSVSRILLLAATIVAVWGQQQLPPSCTLSLGTYQPTAAGSAISLLQLAGFPLCWSSELPISAATVRAVVCSGSISATPFPVNVSDVVLGNGLTPALVTNLCFDVSVPYNCSAFSVCSQPQPAHVRSCTQLTAVACRAQPVLSSDVVNELAKCSAAQQSDTASVELLVSVAPAPQLPPGYICAGSLTLNAALFLCTALGYNTHTATVLQGVPVPPAQIYYSDFSCPLGAIAFENCSYTLSMTQLECSVPAVVRCGPPPCRLGPSTLYGAFCEAGVASPRMLYITENTASHCMELVYVPTVLDVPELLRYGENLTSVPNQSNSVYLLQLANARCDMQSAAFELPFLDGINATADAYTELSFNNRLPPQANNVFLGCVECPNTAPVGYYCSPTGLLQLQSSVAGDTISIWGDPYDRTNVVCLNARIQMTVAPLNNATRDCFIELLDACPSLAGSLKFDGFTQSISRMESGSVAAVYSICPEPPAIVCPPAYAPLTGLTMCGASLYNPSVALTIRFQTENTFAFNYSVNGVVTPSCSDVYFLLSGVSLGCSVNIMDTVSMRPSCVRSSPLWGQFQMLCAMVFGSASTPSLLLNMLDDTIPMAPCSQCPDYNDQQFCGSDGVSALVLHRDGTFVFVTDGNPTETRAGHYFAGTYTTETLPWCVFRLTPATAGAEVLPVLLPKDPFTFCLVSNSDAQAISCSAVPQRRQLVFRQCLLPPTLPMTDFCSDSMKVRLSLQTPMRAVLYDTTTGFGVSVSYLVLARNLSLIVTQWPVVRLLLSGLKNAVPQQVVFSPETLSFVWYFGDGYQYMTADACKSPTLLRILLHTLNGCICGAFVIAVIFVNWRSRRTALPEAPASVYDVEME